MTAWGHFRPTWREGAMSDVLPIATEIADITGYALANAGHDTRVIQDWLGHRSIQHTVRYTELSVTRFRAAPCEACRGFGLRHGNVCGECQGKGYRLFINGNQIAVRQDKPQRWQSNRPAQQSRNLRSGR